MPGTTGTVAFKYDPFGRRIQKSSASGMTNYLYEGSNTVADLDGAGNLVARYTQGAGIDEPLAQFRSGTVGYYDQDGLGSVTTLSSATGTIGNSYTYDSFGNLVASAGSAANPFQYTGRDFDSETGLRYYRARYYDSSTGRFLSEDLIGFEGGINFYAYAGNEPVDWIDPSGLKMSPAECDALRKGIMRKAVNLAKELAKYDPISDGVGGHKMRWGTGVTTPGGHYREMGQDARGIMKDAVVYWKECRKCDRDNNPRLPEWVFDQVSEYNHAPPPVIPATPQTMDDLGIHSDFIGYWRDRQFDQLTQPKGAPLAPVGVPGILGVLGKALGAL